MSKAVLYSLAALLTDFSPAQHPLTWVYRIPPGWSGGGSTLPSTLDPSTEPKRHPRCTVLNWGGVVAWVRSISVPVRKYRCAVKPFTSSLPQKKRGPTGISALSSVLSPAPQHQPQGPQVYWGAVQRIHHSTRVLASLPTGVRSRQHWCSPTSAHFSALQYKPQDL